MINLIIKGGRFAAAAAATERHVPFTFVREVDNLTVGHTSASQIDKVANWYGELIEKPFPDGTLLSYSTLPQQCPVCGCGEGHDAEGPMLWPTYTVYRPEHDPSGLGRWRVCWQGEDNIPLSVDPTDTPTWADTVDPDPVRQIAKCMVWAIVTRTQ